MRQLLEVEMAAGALGLSSGLEYDPGIYSTTEEVVELAKVAAAHGGRYTSHVRSEDRWFWEAIEEILTIGREAGLPVQVSHIKLALRSLHGQTEKLLGMLDEARAEGIDVTADIYPYTYWHSTLTVMFPKRDFEDRDEATFVVQEMTSPEGMLIPVFEPEPALAGKTLAEISALRGTDPATTLIDLIREAETLRAERKAKGEDDDVESVIAVSMQEADIERLMAWPYINFCTDGGLDGSHPRGFGSFPRVLGRYVRERQVLTLEDAIRKMTTQAASNVGHAGARPDRAGGVRGSGALRPRDRARPGDDETIRTPPRWESRWCGSTVVSSMRTAARADAGPVRSCATGRSREVRPMAEVFNRTQIERALLEIDVTTAIEEGFVAYSQGRVVVPPVGELVFEDPPGDVHIKYGYIKGDEYFVIKVASGFYGNVKLGLPPADGLMLVFSQRTAQLECILLDECHLTNVRTAAAGAVVAKYLAPSKVERIGVFGAGVQGKMQVEALLPIVDCRDVIVWGTGEEELEAYCEAMSGHGLTIETTLDGGKIAATCNLIVTATPSHTPLLRADQIREGTHITAMGSDTREKRARTRDPAQG